MSDLVDKKYIYLGSFDIKSGNIVVSDPAYEFDIKSYEKDCWNLNAFIPNVMKNKWHAWIYQHHYKKGGKRNAILYALHSSIINENETPNMVDIKWNKIADLGVDSGQMVICDHNHYRNDSDVNNNKIKIHTNLIVLAINGII